MSQQLLRRAWDALDSFKQICPDGWVKQDEQLLKDLLDADIKMSGVKLKWVGLTENEIDAGLLNTNYAGRTAGAWRDGVEWAQSQLKDKNT